MMMKSPLCSNFDVVLVRGKDVGFGSAMHHGNQPNETCSDWRGDAV